MYLILHPYRTTHMKFQRRMISKMAALTNTNIFEELLLAMNGLRFKKPTLNA